MDKFTLKTVIFLTILLDTQILVAKDFKCQSLVKCLDDKDFNFCFIHNQIVILDETYTCPNGFKCIEDAHSPCVQNDKNYTMPLIEENFVSVSAEEVMTSTESIGLMELTESLSSPTEFTSTTKMTLNSPTINLLNSTSPRPISNFYNTIELNTKITISKSTTRSSYKVPITTSPTTTSKPILSPICTSFVNYPGPTCKQYYQCFRILWWWDFRLKTCPAGTFFNSSSGYCNEKTICEL